MRRAAGRRRPATRILVALVPVLACGVVAASCGGDDDTPSTVSVTLVPPECEARPPVLRVDLIDAAIAQVEAQLGGPQQYFEINATDLLVNVFVALDDGAKVQAFVYLADELNSRDPQAAQGNTFVASALDFDPQKVTSCVADELPASTATAFEIIADESGVVSYSVIVDSANGGQLVVGVNGDGRVLTVDPV